MVRDLSCWLSRFLHLQPQQAAVGADAVAVAHRRQRPLQHRRVARLHRQEDVALLLLRPRGTSRSREESKVSVRGIAVTAVLMLIGAISLSAQWLKYPTAGIPRTEDGKPNLSAPTPRTADGKPDLSGLWLIQGGYIGDITKDLKPGDVSFQPSAAELYARRREALSKDDPTGRCIVGGVPRSTAVPYPFKILNTNGMVVILYEAVHSYRQIFTDGRDLPKDPNPQWFGYSVGRWQDDTFVVDSAGFNDNVWLDNNGHPGSESLRVTERFKRKDFGHMNIEVTIDDPKTYTKPWTVSLPVLYQADSELLEYMCNENNKDIEHLVGK